jgi:bifunctional non-homologous end joining protein LigD
MRRDFFPTREFHPAEVQRSELPPLKRIPPLKLPKDKTGLEIDVAGRLVKLTNLNKPFWPSLGITKRDLLQYYIDVAPFLLPHIQERAMVMKRYPNGAAGEFFFMKRAPSPRPNGLKPAQSNMNQRT